MDLNELTPELFEKAEFAERRRGYDIDQVERFLEETGTAVAQLLVRHRQLEERAAHAELRLAEAEKQLEQAGSAATAASTERRSASAADEAAEIEQATSTLLMAKRTADATISEAGAEADRIRTDAAAGADRIVVGGSRHRGCRVGRWSRPRAGGGDGPGGTSRRARGGHRGLRAPDRDLSFPDRGGSRRAVVHDRGSRGPGGAARADRAVERSRVRRRRSRDAYRLASATRYPARPTPALPRNLWRWT